eukprot:scaffold12.g8033.t1
MAGLALRLALALVSIAGAAAQSSASQFWSFSVYDGGVHSAAGPVVKVVFRALPDTAVAAYQLQRCSDAACTAHTAVPQQAPFPVLSADGATYMAADVSTALGTIYSAPTRALDQSAALFVVAGGNGTSGGAQASCGYLGASPPNVPCTIIQAALDQAPEGATVFVTPGVYRGPGNVALDFRGKALTLASTNGPELTTIDCQRAASAFVFASGEARATVVDGLSVVNGQGEKGGCVRIVDAAPTLRNCSFANCAALGQGGAIYIEGSTTFRAASPGPLVEGCHFDSNQAVQGAGIYSTGSNLNVSGCVMQRGAAGGSIGRGGGMEVLGADVTVRDTVLRDGYAAYAGGGMVFQDLSNVTLLNVSCVNNTASSFGGCMMAFGVPRVTARGCDFSEASAAPPAGECRQLANRASIFGGAMLVMYSYYEAFATRHNRNWALFAGGGLHSPQAVLRLDGCEVSHNTAGEPPCSAAAAARCFGGGLYVSTNGDFASPTPARAYILNSRLENNSVTDVGGALCLESADEVVVANSSLAGNRAARGGAAYCGSVRGGAGAPLALLGSELRGNGAAQAGGALFVDRTCNASLVGMVMAGNTAVGFGGAIATAENSILRIDQTRFEHNGRSDCALHSAPTGGGALAVGLDSFQLRDQCAAGEGSLDSYSSVAITNSSFEGNAALDRGGGVLVEAGSLWAESVRFASNVAVQGVGGGLALVERCSDGGSCTPVTVTLSKADISGNSAVTAGGGLYYAGNSTSASSSSLVLTTSQVSENAVAWDRDGSRDGGGGGLFLGRPAFNVTGVALASNSAFRGGGLFVGADMADGVVLSGLALTDNQAVVGPAAFWLVAKSPTTPLPASPATWVTAPLPLAESIATEVVAVNFSSDPHLQPPTQVLSNQDIPTFAVDLLDYYGHRALAESGGQCAVAAPADTAANASAAASNSSDASGTTAGTAEAPRPAQVQSTGAAAAVEQGRARFPSLQVSGTINASYVFTVACSLDARRRPAYLAGAAQELSVPLPLTIATCPPGQTPYAANDGCVDCAFGTYSPYGDACLDCPLGAVCPAGSSSTALITQANFWRSSNQSSNFYACQTPGICLNGTATGNAACTTGQSGPLCAVCLPSYFAFAGVCRECASDGLAKGLLAVAVVLFVLMVVAIFWRDWTTTGPGIMTKLKIFVGHLQVLALFREYDVVWPSATGAALSWLDVFNVGLSVTAPECYIASYSFYYLWVFEMVLPVACILFCACVYVVARVALTSADPTGTARREPGSRAARLESLKLRRAGAMLRAVCLPAALSRLCWKNAFWLVTLLYPRCAMTALQLFGVQDIDGTSYLKADFSVVVRPAWGGLELTYQKYLAPGILMLVVFALVIPAFWWAVIFANRRRLEDPTISAKYGFLYGSYSAALPYWETTEMLRKLSIALIPVFVRPQPEGSLQASLAQVVIIACLFFTLWLRPFAVGTDNWLQISSQLVLWLMLLTAVIAKSVDLGAVGSKVLSVFQLLLSTGWGFVMLALLVLAGIRLLHRLHCRRRAARRASSSAAAAAAGRRGRRSKEQGGTPLVTAIIVQAGGSADGESERLELVPTGGTTEEGEAAMPPAELPEAAAAGDATCQPTGDKRGLALQLSAAVAQRAALQHSSAGLLPGGTAEQAASCPPQQQEQAQTQALDRDTSSRIQSWISASEESYSPKALARNLKFQVQ